jgi:hypothetical protein
MRTRRQPRLFLAALAAASLMAAAPRAAMAAEPQGPGQPPAGQGHLVVEQVHNGPLFNAEFKFTQINGEDAYFVGASAGALFDDRFLIGGAGYWQVDDHCNGYGDYYGCDGGDRYDHYDDHGYHGLNGYGGLVLEWYALRSRVVSVSGRGLIGGGVANVGWGDFHDVPDDPQRPTPRHGGGHPVPAGYYYTFDQGYFVFEPQVNVTLRLAPGFALVGGAGYRVVGWADGWENRLDGFTATAALRFGGR